MFAFRVLCKDIRTTKCVKQAGLGYGAVTITHQVPSTYTCISFVPRDLMWHQGSLLSEVFGRPG